MLKEFLRGLQSRAAARKYARRLPPRLRQDFGASKTYTPEQIRSSAARAGLPVEHIVFGYAGFLDEPEFRRLPNSQSPMTYQELRAMLRRHAPAHATSDGFEPPPERTLGVS